jgi:quinol monooxygenase YgiN
VVGLGDCGARLGHHGACALVEQQKIVKQKMIRHIVMWKLKNAADAAHFKAELMSCSNVVPGMLSFEVGIRSEGYEANCDVVLVSTFADKAALDAYQIHPLHKQVSAGLGALRETRSVIDFEV